MFTLPGKLYWANEGTASIGRANLDGTGVDAPYFISVPAGPHDLALNGSHIYWTEGSATGAIGRANLDGTNPQPGLIPTGGTDPHGIMLDSSSVYWTQTFNALLRIGRVNLDGGGPVTHPFVQTNTNGDACGLSVSVDTIIWVTDPVADPDAAGISSVHGGVFGKPNHNFIQPPNTTSPCGIAVAGGFIYWTNRGDGTIGRAAFNGANPDPDFITTGGSPCGVAVDGAHIYWSDPASDTIGRAPLDGSPDVTGFSIDTGPGSDPCGIAVDPSVIPVPTSKDFGSVVAGQPSDQQSFEIRNTSSTALEVDDITLTGAASGRVRDNGRQLLEHGDGPRCQLSLQRPLHAHDPGPSHRGRSGHQQRRCPSDRNPTIGAGRGSRELRRIRGWKIAPLCGY